MRGSTKIISYALQLDAVLMFRWHSGNVLNQDQGGRGMTY